MSQEALADMIDIDRTYISMLERERSAATLDMLERLSGALDVEPWELIRAAD